MFAFQTMDEPDFDRQIGRSQPDERPHIVVGIDGTEISRQALEVAIEQAWLCDGVVDAIHVWQLPFEMASTGNYSAPIPVGDLHTWAQQTLHETVAGAGNPHGIDVHQYAVIGRPTSVLMRACRGARLLVVGSRGHHRLTGLVIGSVSQHMVAHAPCPVLVVPPPKSSGRLAMEGSVEAGTHSGSSAEDTKDPEQLDDPHWCELSEAACLDLLAQSNVGRLVVVADGSPIAFPVNYVLDGRTIAIRTDSGTKLTWGSLARVAFEVDCFDANNQGGWSVLVQGTGREITDGVDWWSERLKKQTLKPWAGGEKAHWIAISAPVITGRLLERSYPNSAVSASA